MVGVKKIKRRELMERNIKRKKRLLEARLVRKAASIFRIVE